MRYNKVKVAPKMLNYIAPAYIGVGDSVLYTLRDGRVFEGVVDRIVEKDVTHYKDHCEIILLSSGSREEESLIKLSQPLKFADCLNYVTVAYQDSSFYTYANYFPEVVVGSYVVTNNSKGMRVGCVKGITSKPCAVTMEVIALVDLSRYNELTKIREEILCTTKQIKQYIANKSEDVICDLLAAKDAEFAQLLQKKTELQSWHCGYMRD